MQTRRAQTTVNLVSIERKSSFSMHIVMAIKTKASIEMKDSNNICPRKIAIYTSGCPFKIVLTTRSIVTNCCNPHKTKLNRTELVAVIKESSADLKPHLSFDMRYFYINWGGDTNHHCSHQTVVIVLYWFLSFFHLEHLRQSEGSLQQWNSLKLCKCI